MPGPRSNLDGTTGDTTTPNPIRKQAITHVNYDNVNNYYDNYHDTCYDHYHIGNSHHNCHNINNDTHHVDNHHDSYYDINNDNYNANCYADN